MLSPPYRRSKMSKPEDIPQDVWDSAGLEAMKFVDWLGRGDLDSDAEHVLTVSISNAVMAAKAEEREACARLSFLMGKGLEIKALHSAGVTSDVAYKALYASEQFADLTSTIRSRT
jgi:hypothetical protein